MYGSSGQKIALLYHSKNIGFEQWGSAEDNKRRSPSNTEGLLLFIATSPG